MESTEVPEVVEAGQDVHIHVLKQYLNQNSYDSPFKTVKSTVQL